MAETKQERLARIGLLMHRYYTEEPEPRVRCRNLDCGPWSRCIGEPAWRVEKFDYDEAPPLEEAWLVKTGMTLAGTYDIEAAANDRLTTLKRCGHLLTRIVHMREVE